MNNQLQELDIKIMGLKMKAHKISENATRIWMSRGGKSNEYREAHAKQREVRRRLAEAQQDYYKLVTSSYN
jgi:hypothetical protein